MKVDFFIALRYIFSRKSRNIINWITWISMIGITVGTAAVIIVLSIFNGLTGFIEQLYSAMDPDIKIVAADGFYLPDQEDIYEQLKNHPEVAAICRTVEGKVGLQYSDFQDLGTLKGVDTSFRSVNPGFEPSIHYGSYDFTPYDETPKGLFGGLIMVQLRAYDATEPIQLIYLPGDRKISMTNPLSAVKVHDMYASGHFGVQKEYDEEYVLADIDFVREFLENEDQISGYEIRLHRPRRMMQVKEELSQSLPDAYKVLDRYAQHETMYRLMRNEKLIGYLILTLMLILTAVNIVGSLSMIVLEKQRDIAVLKSMGASSSLVRSIFLWAGLIIGGLSVCLGMFLAFSFGILQQTYGLIKLRGGDSFLVEAYPLQLQSGDFILIFITVMVLSILAALYPARKAAQVDVVEGLSR